jgi:hypothetical protein
MQPLSMKTKTKTKKYMYEICTYTYCKTSMLLDASEPKNLVV